MTTSFARQAQYALASAFGASVLIETSAVAKAHELTFEGSWLFAIGAVVFAVIALWLTCLGALRSDRRDRFRSTARSADRGGPVYTDVDGYMQVH